jgi:hypothetical protein
MTTANVCTVFAIQSTPRHAKGGGLYWRPGTTGNKHTRAIGTWAGVAGACTWSTEAAARRQAVTLDAGAGRGATRVVAFEVRNVAGGEGAKK